MIRKDITEKSFIELSEEFKALGLPRFNVVQVWQWLWEKRVFDFSEMSNLSKKTRELLKNEYDITSLKILERQVSSIDETVKYLYLTNDGNLIECVVMKYKYGYSICISTEVGCKMGCTFCASAIGGFKRTLTAAEMLSEIITAEKDLDIKISNCVLMGTGEPLDNFENVLKFIEIITDKKGFNMANRHITLSTCGIVPKIYELAEKKLQITLAVSLHAPNDEIRKKSMPIAKVYGMEELLTACRVYEEKTGRRVSFEYALIDGLNSSRENAEELGRKIKGTLCHINLIPVNNVRERNYKSPNKNKVGVFKQTLEKYGISVTVRRTLGFDIDASCGQLRAKALNKEERK